MRQIEQENCSERGEDCLDNGMLMGANAVDSLLLISVKQRLVSEISGTRRWHTNVQ